MTSILYLIELFSQSELLKLIYSSLAGVLLFSTLFFLSNVNRVVVLTLVAIGSYLLIREDAGFKTAVLGLGENTNLLSLFLLIPLIGTFMSTAGYLSALKQKVQAKTKATGAHPYRLSFILTATISILLNFGSMAIVKRIIDESFSGFQNKKLTLNIMRAFATSMFWSPYFVNVALVLVLFDVAWIDIGGFGLIIACIYILICIAMFRYISFPVDPLIERTDSEEKSFGSSSLRPFALFAIVLVCLSFLLDFILEVNMLTIVSLLSIVLPIIWAVLSKVFKTFIQNVIEQIFYSFERLKNELAVFISAGFLGVAMSLTNIGALISGFLFEASYGSIYLLSLLLVLIATLLAQIAIHPVIIVIGIGSALSPAMFGVSAEYLALLLLISWSIATQLSPFSGQILMASRLMEQPSRVIVKQNILFVSLSGVILTTILYSFYLLGWV
ncbi:hypothetical protein [Halalkalibacter krulwichiae]|uniref:Uncharacterized protein n=1 Tax=Halalkalibacter krulwichiae TaxID=199441 RepID=A0A1X9MAX0_9BACI|nr:hypothetical protein [Halalkalibacter krulwichiae]ARK30576.1 hypothetical protein BkAM31D_12465 [Halalkalibacter krulwichiae]